MGWLAVLFFVLLVVAGAWVPAAAVADANVPRFLVALWVVGATEIVALAILLSPFSLLTRPALLWAAGLVAVVTLSVGRRARLRPPPVGPAVTACATVIRDPALAVLAATNVVVLGYSAALAFFTPPSEDDAITYHLVRSAFWKQDASIGWIRDVVDLRANVSPPISEILVAAFMVVGGHERFAGIPQLTALPVVGLVAYGLGRRIGLGPREAALGGLAAPLLPVALIQASTAMNDLLYAALAGAVGLFVLNGRARELVVAAAGLALMVGTKTASVFVIPSLGLLAAVGRPWRSWLPRAGVGIAALAVGSAWYLVNLRETGELSGGLTEQQATKDLGDLPAHVARLTRYLQSAIELPGAIGRDRYLYVLVGAVLVVAGLVLRRRSTWLAGAIVAAVPLLLPVRDLADTVYRRGWFKLGREDLSRYDPGDFSGSIVATGYTWYGPVGLALVVAALVVVVIRVRRGSLPMAALVLATAPVIALTLMAVTLEWGGAYGRLIMGSVVLSAGTWGVVSTRRWATVSVATVSALVALTSIVWWNKKPLGIRLLEPARATSIWSTPRSRVQEVLDGTAPFLAEVERVVPADGSITVVAALPPYSLFGPGLDRHITVGTTSATARGDWLVLASGATPACPSSWEQVTGVDGPFTLYHRVGPDCAHG